MQKNYINDELISSTQEDQVPEEIASPLCSLHGKIKNKAIQRTSKVEDKLRSYDTGKIIDQKQSNPLLKNKGYIADDWKWEQTLKDELKQMAYHRDRAKNKTFYTGQLSEITKNLNGRPMIPPAAHRDSGKNTLLSYFNLNQSTNHAGPHSNNINIKEMQSQTHNKDSNNRLTFKTLNDNTWEAQNSNQFIRSSLDNEEQKQNRPSPPEQQTFRDKLQPRNKLSSMKGLRYKNLQTLEVPLKDEIQKYPPAGTGQIFCDNIIQEIQESQEELKSSIQDSQFKKSQTAFVSMRDTDSLIVKKPYQRMRSQAVLTVKRQELQFHQLSKSYVYLIKGLSDEIDNIERKKEGLENYNSLFFEKDMDIEQYKESIKEALQVQFEKQITISSHEQIKFFYERWVKGLQKQFKKTSLYQKTIVFDLDETLVRAQEQEPEFGYDQRIKVIDSSENGQYYLYVKWRPGLLDALNVLSQHFELILFTAANFSYADIVLQTFEGHQFFSHILVRDQCLFIQKVFIKDLQILTKGRSLKDVIIVDNKIESYSSHLENGIPIKSYYGEFDDDRLPLLVQHLMKLKEVRDVRTQILKDFFLKEVTDKQKQNDEIIDSARIKQCMLNDKEKYQHQKYQENKNRKFSRTKNRQIIDVGRF